MTQRILVLVIEDNRLVREGLAALLDAQPDFKVVAAAEGASAGLLQVGLETRSSGSFYSGKGAGIVRLKTGGAHMAGDVTETVKARVTPHVLHVTGDATCGLKGQQ